MMGSHPSTISRFVVSSWDTRTMWTYAARYANSRPAPIAACKGDSEEERFWLEERRQSVIGNDRVTRQWGTTQIVWIYEISERASETKTPPAAALISVAQKDGELQLWVDYRPLNQATEWLSPHTNRGRQWVQNRISHPVPVVRVPSHAVHWRTHQLPYYQTTSPNTGDKSSAEQRRLKRGMTLQEVPEWRTRVHLMTEKSSGTQRAGIRVPRQFTAKAQSQRQQEQTKRSPKRWKEVERSTRSQSKHQASWHTKEVNDQSVSKSLAKACGKMRRKQVLKLDKASRPRPAKVKQIRWAPKSRDEGCRKTCQSTKITRSIWNHDCNQQHIRV